MDDVLRKRVLRHLEALPDERLYQVLDYIEFLASKYAQESIQPASSLQRFGERLQDSMRRNKVGYGALRGTLQAMGTADKVFSNITEAGRTLLRDVEKSVTPPADERRTEPVRLPPDLPPPVSLDPDIDDDDQQPTIQVDG